MTNKIDINIPRVLNKFLPTCASRSISICIFGRSKVLKNHYTGQWTLSHSYHDSKRNMYSLLPTSCCSSCKSSHWKYSPVNPTTFTQRENVDKDYHNTPVKVLAFTHTSLSNFLPSPTITTTSLSAFHGVREVK